MQIACDSSHKCKCWLLLLIEISLVTSLVGGCQSMEMAWTRWQGNKLSLNFTVFDISFFFNLEVTFQIFKTLENLLCLGINCFILSLSGLENGDHLCLWFTHHQRAWGPCVNISAVKTVFLKGVCGPVLDLNVMSCSTCWSTTWVLSVLFGRNQSKTCLPLFWGKAPVYIRIIHYTCLMVGKQPLWRLLLCADCLFAYYKFEHLFMAINVNNEYLLDGSTSLAAVSFQRGKGFRGLDHYFVSLSCVNCFFLQKKRGLAFTAWCVGKRSCQLQESCSTTLPVATDVLQWQEEPWGDVSHLPLTVFAY